MSISLLKIMPQNKQINFYENGFARMKPLFLEPRLKKVEELLKNLFIPGSRLKILDMGCGDGIFAVKLKKILKTNQVYGTDISSKAIKIAKKNINAVICNTDSDKLPYRKSYFDFIFCGNLIETVHDADKLLGEIARVVKPDGQIIVTYPNHVAWLSRVAVLLGKLPFYYRVSTAYDLGKLGLPTTKSASTGHIRLLTVEAFTKLADFYGLSVVQNIGVHEPALPHIFKFLDKIISKKPEQAFRIICILKKK